MGCSYSPGLNGLSEDPAGASRQEMFCADADANIAIFMTVSRCACSCQRC